MATLTSGEWECPVCTYLNIPARTICETCNTPRRLAASPTPPPTYNRAAPTAPRAIPTSSSTPSITARSPSPLPPSPLPITPSPVASSGWVCPRCTFLNDATRAHCDICDLARPSTVLSVPSPAASPSAPPPRQPSPVQPSPSPPLPPRTTAASSRSPTTSSLSSATVHSSSTPTSSPSASLRPPLTPPPPPPPPAVSTALSRADKAYAKAHQASVDWITSKGFTAQTAIDALRQSDGDHTAALDWIARNPPAYAAQSPAKAPHEGPPISLQSLKGSRAAPSHLTLPTDAGGKAGKTGTPVSSGSVGSGNSGALSRSVPSSTPTFSAGGAGGSDADRKRREEERKRDEERKKRELAEQKEKEAQAARLREEERARLFAELKKQEDDVRLREKEARLAEVEDVKRRREEEERARKLQSIQREREAERARAAELREKEEKQREKAAQITTLDDAIRAFTSSYDTERIHSTYRLLIRILTSVLQRPHEERLRSLKMASEGVQRLIVRPLFGLWVLKHLGWREEERGQERVLVWDEKAVDAAKVKAVVGRLQGEMAQIVTPVPAFFASLSSSQPVEALYFVALELHAAFLNVVTEPTERNFLSIDRQSPTFLTLFAPLPAFPSLLAEFGYAADRSGTYFIVEQPAVPRFEAAVLELTAIIQRLRPTTPIVQGVQAMLAAGKGKLVKAFIAQLVAACEKVLEDPHETRYHRVRLDRVWRKVGGEVPHGQTMWTVLGWTVMEAEGKEKEEGGEGMEGAGAVAVQQYHGFDPELLRLRVRELSRAWKDEVERRRRAKDQEERSATISVDGPRAERHTASEDKMDTD